ncbi:TetR/AcrR family transcriptional regulator [Acuticoccus mangrovi]|uniref:TetR/AcrR family transcriptional regulator n=1 Tax=Acuticoccus mangrovi TaxID=2796142 RepID=A0A934IEZ7_9HYPH|nr:TetR/AcrR family transcriptional regulator [Acuticoccus mangrovi]
MDIKTHIISRAEPVFDENGFAATGMDRLTQAAQVSSRTLYKHLGGKTELICAVLDARRQRFFDQLDVDSVDALFAALETWARTEGARGCFFLRAQGEMGGREPAVAAQVSNYRRELHERIARVLANDLGEAADGDLLDQILVLFEGATSMASYRGPAAFAAARSAAARLLNRTTGHANQ